MPWEVAEKPRKVRSATDWSEEYDPVRAILAESARSARMLKPVRIGDVVEFLRAEGRSIRIAGPRLFIMDGQSANWAGIVDAANAIRSERDETIFVPLSVSENVALRRAVGRVSAGHLSPGRGGRG